VAAVKENYTDVKQLAIETRGTKARACFDVRIMGPSAQPGKIGAGNRIGRLRKYFPIVGGSLGNLAATSKEDHYRATAKAANGKAFFVTFPSD
jgi:hypothetical protein